jgi:hypothetical protein
MTLVGAAVLPTGSQTWPQAITAFEAATGRAMPIRRCYDQAPPSSIAGGQLKHDLGLRASIYSIKPTISTPLATLESLAADIVANEHPCDVIIYHEPVDNMVGADFIALYQRSCQPFRDQGIPVGVCYTNYSCNLPYSDPKSALHGYWPGDSLVDFIAIDEYPKGEITSTTDAVPMDQRTRRVTEFADARGISLGLAEYGVDGSWDVAKSDRWLRSVTDWAEAREVAGRPLPWMTYFSCVASPYNWTITNKAEFVDSYTDSYRVLS